MITPFLITAAVLTFYQLYLQWDELAQGEEVQDYVILSCAQLFLILVSLLYVGR